MRRFYQPLFALLISVVLLASQQAAFAHLLGHLRWHSTSPTSYQQDDGATDALAEACTTCIAFAGMSGGAAPTKYSLSFSAPDRDRPQASAAFSLPARRVGIYLARAPPALL